jgi:hypothetical protein
MKQEKYILKIEKPCKEDWALMIKNDLGKYCSNCANTVTDFTGMTDSEIIKRIGQNSEKLCGRLKNQQLNRLLIEDRSKNNFSHLYKFLSGLLLLGTVENSFSKNKVFQTEIIQTIDSAKSQSVAENKIQYTDSLKNIIHGVVIDKQTKETIPFASILVKGTQISMVANIDGEFKLLLPENILEGSINLVISYAGYESAETLINGQDLPITKEFIINPLEGADAVLVGYVCFEKKKKWWQRKEKSQH